VTNLTPSGDAVAEVSPEGPNDEVERRVVTSNEGTLSASSTLSLVQRS